VGHRGCGGARPAPEGTAREGPRGRGARPWGGGAPNNGGAPMRQAGRARRPMWRRAMAPRGACAAAATAGGRGSAATDGCGATPFVCNLAITTTLFATPSSPSKRQGASRASPRAPLARSRGHVPLAGPTRATWRSTMRRAPPFVFAARRGAAPAGRPAGSGGRRVLHGLIHVGSEGGGAERLQLRLPERRQRRILRGEGGRGTRER
jgi:hypothetical protein